jgi:hypothetical protein
MYEILKAIALLNNWPFMYARKDWRNLYDDIERPEVNHIFLDPVTTKKLKGDMGVTESITYSGSFLILRDSDLDDDNYEFRYQEYIKPILDEDLEEKIEDVLRCEHEAKLDMWETTEVINITDHNLDGVLVVYSISIDV